MPNSMTAFAREQHQADWGTLVCEIRSVNHRYLELQFRMPEQIRDIEMALRDVVRNVLQRGKVEINFRLDLLAANNAELQINQTALEKLIAATAAVSKQLPQSASVNPLHVLQWPGVLQQAEMEETLFQQAAEKLLHQTLQQLAATRAREGKELQGFIQQRLDKMAEIVAHVKQKIPAVLQLQRQRLQEKLAELQLQVDADRLEQEMVMLTQKADVEEELDRLHTHLQEVQRVLKNPEANGRRLDFLMQELNREANTLSSKSINTDITQNAVELKVLIEQMREQVQNIE